MNKRFGRNDVIFIAFMALVCIATCVAVYQGGAVKGSTVTITLDGKIYGTYSLLKEQTIEIKEGNKLNIIEIKDGKATMKEASCPDQLCVDQNDIGYDKESIICLPNKVVISVSSDADNDVDIMIR